MSRCRHPLVEKNSISNLSVLSVDVTGAFGADADNQALERSVVGICANCLFFWRALLTLLISYRLEKKYINTAT